MRTAARTTDARSQFRALRQTAAAARPSVRLTIARGHARNLVREVSEPVYLIGGGVDCDLVLGDAQFPDVCAYVFVSESGVSIRWLGVGPELTVNGRPVEKRWLYDGDRVRLGPFEFSVAVDVQQPQAASESTSRRRADSGHGIGQEAARSLLRDVRNEFA